MLKIWIVTGLLVFYLLICLLIYFFQELVLFHPVKLESGYKYDFKLSHKEFNVKTKDGNMLNALYFPAPENKGLIVYYHGNADNLSRWGKVAEDFTKLGFSVAMYDYRGFGKSTGKITDEAHLHEDAELFYDYCRQTFPSSKIILYGRSLGSGLAIKQAVTHAQDILVLETPYHSFVGLGKHYLPMIPFERLNRYSIRSEDWIANVKCPIFIIHGDRDLVVPQKFGKLLSGKNSNSTFISIEGGKHKNLNIFEKYHKEIKNILSRI